MSSLGNLIIVLVAARRLPLAELGLVAVALALYSLCTGIARAVLTDPLMVRFSGGPADRSRRAAGSVFTAALAISALVGAGLLVGWAAGWLPASVAALGAMLPFLLVQDALRHIAFVIGRPAVAALLDGSWLLVVLALAVGPAVSLLDGPGAVVLAWGGGAGVACAIGILVLRVRPGAGAGEWLRSHRGLSTSAAAEFLCLAGATQAVSLVVATVGDPSTAGTLRTTAALLGPVSVLANGAHVAIVAEGVRGRAGASGRSLRHVARRVPAALALAAIAWGVLLRLLPTGLGEALTGDAWPSTQAVLVPYALVFGGLIAATELGAVLRALDRVETAVRAAAPLLVGCLVAATWAAPNGAGSVSRALIVPVWAGVVLYGWQVRGALRDERSRPARGAASAARHLVSLVEP